MDNVVKEITLIDKLRQANTCLFFFFFSINIVPITLCENEQNNQKKYDSRDPNM